MRNHLTRLAVLGGSLVLATTGIATAASAATVDLARPGVVLTEPPTTRATTTTRKVLNPCRLVPDLCHPDPCIQIARPKLELNSDDLTIRTLRTILPPTTKPCPKPTTTTTKPGQSTTTTKPPVIVDPPIRVHPTFTG